MQPLPRAHISPAFKWPTVLPLARPQGEVCAAASGSSVLEKFRWNKRVKERCAAALSQTDGILGYVNMTTDASVISTNDFSHEWNVINH